MRKLLPLLLGALLMHAAWAGQSVSPVAYEVTVNPNEKVFHVSVRMEGVNAPNVDFAMPTWTPGYYSVVNFGKWVRNFKATAGDGKELKVETPNNFTWRIGTQDVKQVNIQYDVEAVTEVIGAELQSSAITSQGAFINGTAVFGYIVGQTARPAIVEFKIPQGWRVATAMAAKEEVKKTGVISGMRVASLHPERLVAAGSKRPATRSVAQPPRPPAFPLNIQPTPTAYAAPNYDTLVDSPIVLGQFQRADLTLKNLPINPPPIAPPGPKAPGEDFSALGAPPPNPKAICPVSIVIQGDSLAPAEWMKLAPTVEKIAKAQIGMMQDVPASYLFIFRLNDKAEEVGGLEHTSSSVIVMPKKTLLENVFGAYTMAQMFFHQWNGKRIRPDYFNNMNYAVVPDRPHLWFFKGVTHYFAYLTLLRAGLWKSQEFLEQLAGTKQTPVAIHQRGAHLGLLLDVRLRELTNNQKSLEGFLRHLNETFGKKNQPYGANGILEQLNAYTGGTNPFNEFYQAVVVREEDLPMDEVLSLAGWKLEAATEKSPAKIIELPPPTADEQKQNPTLKPQAERRAVIRQGLLLGKNDAAPTVPPLFTIVSVTPDKPAVKQDNSVQLQVKISRHYDYQGEITLMVNGLPANVTAEPVTLKGAQTDATLTIKAAANAAVANAQNVTVSATAMLGGQSFTQTSAAMTLAVQAK
jgi:predicted metalloprotease with PDZ domain